MRLSKAKVIIASNIKYLVHLEWCGDGFLRADYFPDPHQGETGFDTEAEAIQIATAFAKATEGRACNFYLVRADNFSPIGEWRLNNRQPGKVIASVLDNTEESKL